MRKAEKREKKDETRVPTELLQLCYRQKENELAEPTALEPHPIFQQIHAVSYTDLVSSLKADLKGYNPTLGDKATCHLCTDVFKLKIQTCTVVYL